MRGWLTMAAVVVGVAGWVTLDGRMARSAPQARAPEIRSARWLNTAPIAPASLRGKVVAVEFWTYG
jgi:hypothetical protein